VAAKPYSVRPFLTVVLKFAHPSRGLETKVQKTGEVQMKYGMKAFAAVMASVILMGAMAAPASACHWKKHCHKHHHHRCWR
jgi:hypothetical protein